MATLKSRQQSIPGGFRFRIPELKFETPSYASFDTVVSAVLKVVRANPELAAKKGWPTDQTGVENWVDFVNANICAVNGWKDYIVGDPYQPPKTTAPGALQRLQDVAGAVRKINAGVKLLLEWEHSGEAPVANGIAEHRASICETCPQNGKGDLTRWFTVPASEIIRSQLNRIHDLKLATSRDDKLGICQVCLCPLKLKIWCSQALVEKHLSEETKKELPSFCWVLGK